MWKIHLLWRLDISGSFSCRAIARAKPSPIGKPFSATSIACSSTWAKFIVPQRSSSTYHHASITPGSDAESSPSLLGILPPLCLLCQSIVASFGAVPRHWIRSTPVSCPRGRPGCTRVGRRPDQLDSGLTSASTACSATMASNALPPDSRIMRGGSSCLLFHRRNGILRAPHDRTKRSARRRRAVGFFLAIRN